jgi:hypothetical protein
MWPVSAGHVARITMAAQMGYAIEKASVLDVWKITIDSAAAKNIALSKNE